MDQPMRMIVLAAGTGSRLRPITNNRPKCMVEVAGKPMFEWTLDAAEKAGIDEVIVVGGYLAEKLEKYDVKLLINEDFASTNMVHTLFQAKEFFGSGFVMSYGDIVYNPEVLSSLMSRKDDISVVVDKHWETYWRQRFEDPLDDAETLKMNANGNLIDIGRKPSDITEIEAQYIGLVSFGNAEGVAQLCNTMDLAEKQSDQGENPLGASRGLKNLYMTDLLQGMISNGAVLSTCPIERNWFEVDDVTDLEIANTQLNRGWVF
jgi:choline kinase